MAQDPLNVLWIEPSFPGRLGETADWLVGHRGYRSIFYCNSVGPKEAGRWPASVGHGLTVQKFEVGGVARESAVSWTQTLERSLCYSYGCAEILSQKMPRPIDLIVGRSAGLGSTLFAPVYYPRVPVVNLFDYYLHPSQNDLAEEPGQNPPTLYSHWRRSANAIELLDLEQSSLSWTHSRWQRDLFPAEYRPDFFVQHDGVDTRRFVLSHWHETGKGRRVIAGRSIPEGIRIVSFVAQSLEKLRGFDRFWKIAETLIRDDPNVLFIAIGDPITRRGLDVEYHNRSLLAALQQSQPISDPERFWFLGAAPTHVVHELLAASDLHLAPGRSYPVARSLLQAMATGCLVIASDTGPHREVISHDRDGLLLAGGEIDRWVILARTVLDNLADYRRLGLSAADLIRERYSREVCLASLAERFTSLALGRV